MKKKASDFLLKSDPKETKSNNKNQATKNQSRKRKEKVTHEPRQINLRK